MSQSPVLISCWAAAGAAVTGELPSLIPSLVSPDLRISQDFEVSENSNTTLNLLVRFRPSCLLSVCLFVHPASLCAALVASHSTCFPQSNAGWLGCFVVGYHAIQSLLMLQAGLVEKIAHLVEDKTLEGVSDVRDESDRSGVRVVVEVKKGWCPDLVMAQLMRHTRLEMRFSCNMVRGGKEGEGELEK